MPKLFIIIFAIVVLLAVGSGVSKLIIPAPMESPYAVTTNTITANDTARPPTQAETDEMWRSSMKSKTITLEIDEELLKNNMDGKELEKYIRVTQSDAEDGLKFSREHSVSEKYWDVKSSWEAGVSSLIDMCKTFHVSDVQSDNVAQFENPEMGKGIYMFNLKMSQCFDLNKDGSIKRIHEV